MTLLPLGTVNAAGIEHTGASYELLTFDGRSSSAGAVRADLLMLGRTFRGQFLVIDQEVGILGRQTFSMSVLFCSMDRSRRAASSEAIEQYRADAGSNDPSATQARDLLWDAVLAGSLPACTTLRSEGVRDDPPDEP